MLPLAKLSPLWELTRLLRPAPSLPFQLPRRTLLLPLSLLPLFLLLLFHLVLALLLLQSAHHHLVKSVLLELSPMARVVIILVCVTSVASESFLISFAAPQLTPLAMATAPLVHASALHMVPLFLRPRRMVATAARYLEKATDIWVSAVSPAITVTAHQRHVNIARFIWGCTSRRDIKYER
jgi:hypothetical protein